MKTIITCIAGALLALVGMALFLVSMYFHVHAMFGPAQTDSRFGSSLLCFVAGILATGFGGAIFYSHYPDDENYSNYSDNEK